MEDTVKTSLDDLGIEFDDAIVFKFVSMATIFDVEPDDLAMAYISFSTSKRLDDDGKLNRKNFDLFEASYQKSNRHSKTPRKKKPRAERNSDIGIPKTPVAKKRPSISTGKSEEALYGIQFTPLKITARSTPSTVQRSRRQIASPMLESPAAGRYMERTKRGQSSATFNERIPPTPDRRTPITQERRSNLSLSQFDSAQRAMRGNIDDEKTLSQETHLPSPHRAPKRRGDNSCHLFMFEEHHVKMNVVRDRLEAVGAQFLKNIVSERKEEMKSDVGNEMQVDEKDAEEDTEKDESSLFDFSSVNEPSQESVYVLGRIADEGDGGKVSASSLFLEGDWNRSFGKHVKLDISQIQEEPIALFAGQMIAVKGVNSTGQEIVVEKIYSDTQRTPNNKWRCRAEDRTQSFLNAVNSGGPTTTSSRPMQIMVAAGPLTTKTSLDYNSSPLRDLGLVICRNHPDMVILMGPFIDREHEIVVNDEMDVTYSDAFKMLLCEFLEQLQAGGFHGFIVLVPSTRDVHHLSSFPQRKFDAPKFDSSEEHLRDYFWNHVECMTNPCEFSFSGVTFGVSSEDVLFDLSSRSIVKNAKDRLTKMASQVVEQQHFYPIDPPKQDLRLDYTHANKLFWSHSPDILILPSRLKTFASTLAGNILCVNPSTLTKMDSGGTYGIITIDSPEGHLKDESAMDVDDGDGGNDSRLASIHDMWKDLSKLCRVDVVRI